MAIHLSEIERNYFILNRFHASQACGIVNEKRYLKSNETLPIALPNSYCFYNKHLLKVRKTLFKWTFQWTLLDKNLSYLWFILTKWLKCDVTGK